MLQTDPWAACNALGDFEILKRNDVPADGNITEQNDETKPEKGKQLQLPLLAPAKEKSFFSPGNLSRVGRIHTNAFFRSVCC